MGVTIPVPCSAKGDSATTAMQIQGSLQFNQSVETYLTRTPSSGGNRRTFTASCWYRKTVLTGSTHVILFAGPNGDDTYPIIINSDNQLQSSHYQGGHTYRLIGPRERDMGSWLHLVAAYDTTQSIETDRVKLYVNGVQITDFSTEVYPSQNYETSINENGVQQRIGFQVTANAFELDGYLTEFNFLDGQSLGPGYFGFTDPLTDTWRPTRFRKSGHPLGTTVNDGTQWSATIGSFTNGANVFNGNLTSQGYANSTGTTTITTGKFEIKNNLRIHNNFRFDGTYYIIINGVSIHVRGYGTTSTNYRWSEVDLSSIETPIIVTSLQYNISQVSGNSLRAIEVDGIIMTDSTTTNLDFGTNGYYLPMDGSGTTVGSDQSGKGNDWTLTNHSSSTVCAQSPSGIVYAGKQRHGGSTTYNASQLPSNYCTLDRNNMGGSITLKNAATFIDSSNVGNVMGTHLIPPNSGKYYWECQVSSTMAGVIGIGASSVANVGNLSDVHTIRGYGADGKKYYGNTGSNYGSVFSNSGWVGVLFDSDQRTLEFTYNGVSQGVAFTAGSNAIEDGVYYAPCFHVNAMDVKANFGANYAYSTTDWSTVPPEGYKTVCDASLSQSTEIVRADQNVGITTYIGPFRADTQSALKFQPDLVWIKKRKGGSNTNHLIFDTVRGFASAGNGRYIIPNSTEVQDAGALLTGFTRNGFAVSNNDLTGGGNDPGNDYVAWSWKAGGDNNTFNVDGVGYASFAASGTPAGATTPTGTSINTKAGFSIIKFTPTSASGTATVPHGLGKEPKFIMMKSLTNAYNWDVYHANATTGGNGRLILNNNNAPDFGFNPFSQVAPTKDVFTFNNAFYGDASDDVICYCWADIPGFSKFGEYHGNGNADGPFVNLGFRPSIIWYKDITSGGYWNIRDDVRTAFNGDAHELYTATNEMENYHPDNYGYDPREIDFYSNGFKILNAHDAINNSSRKYIYMCWAKGASGNLYGGQANGR